MNTAALGSGGGKDAEIALLSIYRGTLNLGGNNQVVCVVKESRNADSGVWSANFRTFCWISLILEFLAGSGGLTASLESFSVELKGADLPVFY